MRTKPVIPLAFRALRAGAVDFPPPPSDHILESVARAERRMGNLNGPGLPKRVFDTRLAKLPEGESEVMEQMLLGRLNKELPSIWISAPGPSKYTGRVFLRKCRCAALPTCFAFWPRSAILLH